MWVENWAGLIMLPLQRPLVWWRNMEKATLDYATIARPHRSLLARTPLYIKIVIALALGVAAGELLPVEWARRLDVPARMILRVLGAIAPPLILVAVLRALIAARVQGKLAGKMFFLLALNTLVAILIGLLVANVIRPGGHE